MTAALFTLPSRLARFRADLAAAFRRLFARAPRQQPAPRSHPHTHTIILAYNFAQAREHARVKGLGHDWVYASVPEHLYGYDRVNLIFLPSWSVNKNWAFCDAVERLKRRNEEGKR